MTPIRTESPKLFECMRLTRVLIERMDRGQDDAETDATRDARNKLWYGLSQAEREVVGSFHIFLVTASDRRRVRRGLLRVILLVGLGAVIGILVAACRN